MRPVKKIGSETPPRAIDMAARSKSGAAAQRGDDADADPADQPEDRGARGEGEGHRSAVEQVGPDGGLGLEGVPEAGCGAGLDAGPHVRSSR